MRIVNVASRLDDYGVETVVVHPTQDAARLTRKLNQAEISHRGLRLHRLTKHVPTLLKYIAFWGPEIARIRRVLAERKIDLVHCNGAWQVKGMIASYLAGIPAIWHLNDTYMPLPVRKMFGAIAPWAANGFILSCKRTRNYYLHGAKLQNKPSKVIHPPVDTEEFDPHQVEPDKKIDGYDGLTVVTVATINSIKRLEDFVDVAHRICSTLQKEIQFFIVGPIYESQRDYGRQLKARAKERGCDSIHFTGRSESVPSILKASDLYVCTSQSESGPISVWEAMSMGIPVVSTDVGDVHQFLERDDAPAGAVVNVGDVEGLARQILRFLRDRGLRVRAGENARKVACAELDLNVCAKKHATFYRSVSENCQSFVQSDN